MENTLFPKIDKLVFDALAKRSSIAIPQIGTLKVIRLAAQGRTLSPTFKVILTEEEAEFDLEKEMLNIEGITKENLKEVEEAWINHCTNTKEAMITTFTLEDYLTIIQQGNEIDVKPSSKLNYYLNPEMLFTKHSEPKRDYRKIYLITGGVVLIGVGLFLFLNLFNGEFFKTEEPNIEHVSTTIIETTPLTTAQEADTLLLTETVAVENPVIEEIAPPAPSKEETKTTTPIQAQSKVVSTPQPIKSTPSKPQPKERLHRVVIGSFSVKENADKFATTLKKDFPQTETMPYGPLTIVVIYSNPAKEAAVNWLNALPESQKPKDYWYLFK